MTIRNAIGKIHLWLGLTSGLLVFIIAITGCIYAFQDEIQDLTQSYRFVVKQATEHLAPSVIKGIAEKQLPGREVHAILYQGDERAAKAIFYKDGADYYYFVYVNQYTGEVLKVKNENRDFFRVVLDGHYYLWLPPAVGHLVVASATLIFFVMLLSGFFLWWPRNKNGAKQRFTIKLNARWRRKNYDLHNVVGFYFFLFAMVFAITGLVWGFQWFSALYYGVISGGKKQIEYKEALSVSRLSDGAQSTSMDRIWARLRTEVPAKGTIEVHTPTHDSAAIAVNINPDPGTYWKTDYRYFNQYTLGEIPVEHMWGRFKSTSRAQKLMRMNYDIHVGALLGFPGKIMAFLCSLVIASLPITGTLIWWGRRNKKPAKN